MHRFFIINLLTSATRDVTKDIQSKQTEFLFTMRFIVSALLQRAQIFLATPLLTYIFNIFFISAFTVEDEEKRLSSKAECNP